MNRSSQLLDGEQTISMIADYRKGTLTFGSEDLKNELLRKTEALATEKSTHDLDAIEHIDWHNRAIFNPKGKTPEARRSVPMSDRVSDLLMPRCAGKTAGWVTATHVTT
jgi:hypothetical protein